MVIALAIVFTFGSLTLLHARNDRGRKSVFDRDDENGDGKLSQEEFSGPSHIFDKMDKDGDGFITRQEAKEWGQKGQQERQQDSGELVIDIWVKDKACNGTTLFALAHPKNPRIVEVDMQGKVVWQYVLPENLKQYTNPGFDVELLPDNNILFVLPLKGVYEINRKGNIVWSYLDKKVSHDADRLPNGNTLVVWGGDDKISDAQVKEINPKGEIVWSWYAKEHFYKPPHQVVEIDRDTGKTVWKFSYPKLRTARDADRLPNGNTLIVGVIEGEEESTILEVIPAGEVVWKLGLKNAPAKMGEKKGPGWFYKAERIPLKKSE